MTLFVFGGSNSLIKTGWTRTYQDVHGPLYNRSVGATSGFTGLYRLLTTAEARRGDVVVWEYALNDQIVVKAGRNVSPLLTAAEFFLIEARARGLRVVALLLKTQGKSHKPNSAYYDGLLGLFQHYGVTVADIGNDIVDDAPTGLSKREMFRDGAHYAERPVIMEYIARRVQDAQAKAQVPTFAPALRTGNLKARFKPSSGRRRFKNAILDVAFRANRETFCFDEHVTALSLMYLESRFRNQIRVTVPTPGGAREELSKWVGRAGISLLSTMPITKDGVRLLSLAANLPLTVTVRPTAHTRLMRLITRFTHGPAKANILVVGLLYATPHDRGEDRDPAHLEQ